MAPRSRHAVTALALAALVAASAHALIPHSHPWATDEAHAAPAEAALPPVVMHPGDTLDVTGQGCLIARNTTGNAPTASLRLTCQGAAATATATAMPSSTATKTPTPPPAATATSTPSAAMIEGVPVCTDHDATKWHPLVKKSGSTIVCTYGHEHHANPHDVDDIFGPPSAWYGGTQEISYPWQTSSTLGQENQVKHEGYKWHVERDQPCRPAGPPPDDGCLIAWRVQAHSMGTASDAVVRFHSYSFEALVEYHGTRSIVRHGGHLDFGHLALIVGGGGPLCPTLASNPPTFSCGDNNHRNHSGVNVPPPYTDTDIGLAAWYSRHEISSLSTTVEEWGPEDYQDPARQLFHPAAQRGNNSVNDLGNMFVQTNPSWLAPYTTGGLVTFNGYTDRNGEAATGSCTAPGVDCVPLRLNGAPAAIYLWASAVQGPSFHQYDWDVPSPITGNSLIRFPN